MKTIITIITLIAANLITLLIIYAITCFNQWQFPVDFGSWESHIRGMYISFVAMLLLFANFFTVLMIHDL